MVLPYIFETSKPDLKRDILLGLVSRSQKKVPQLLDMIVMRMRYSFYAYCEIQNALDYKTEMWIIPVVKKAIPYIPEQDMPYIIHFSLLFHHLCTQAVFRALSHPSYILPRSGCRYNLSGADCSGSASGGM